ncbi:MAG TPA: TetR/AcrR family transcriptional regulator [Solirubrobacteraceae bacterium]|nr:TetR/AcrR family transcriptional regulator [Solirubrobacteraceae bacterium]
MIANQRTRIHGAMIEAVSRNGYEGTSVKQVIALAGVSRRSFYEQFDNKQSCFLATFDVIAKSELEKARRRYLESAGTPPARLRAILERYKQMTAEDCKASVLAVLETQTAGVSGMQRLLAAIGACEQMIAQGFAQAPGMVSLPAPIVRAIAGGMHGIASAFLRDTPASRGLDVTEELEAWTLLFQAPAAERMAECMAAALSVRLREIASACGHGHAGAEAASRDERARLMHAVLRLATREEYRTVSAPQIADEANVSIEVFWQLFVGKDECYLAALDDVAGELLAVAAESGPATEDWPHAVRRVLAELMRHLAERPLHTRTLAQEAFFAGAEAVERVRELSLSIATLLTEGAPTEAASPLATEAIASAIWHTMRCQVAAGRVQLLAALSEHLAYIVLAPYIGAQAAAEILAESLSDRDGAGGTAVQRGT